MDNLCHTLVGAAFGEAGLKQRTRYGSVALMIAANLPDLDVLVFATDVPSVSFRRGWTHGVAAQVLLPVLLTAACWMAARRSGRTPPQPLRVGWLLVLSYLGVYSHIFLDFLNTYGVRWLTPMDWRWFYGDAVFIVDPWLWLSLGSGVWLARRRAVAGPARAALACAAVYILAMLVTAQVARAAVIDAWRDAHGTAPRALMVGPVPVSPLSRAIIVDAGDHYETGTFRFWPHEIRFDRSPVPKNDAAPAVALARDAAPNIRGFLVWSRFPFWTHEPDARGTRVSVWDMRFAAGGARFSQSTVVGEPYRGSRLP